MKALAQILFEISCTQDFQILFSKGHNSEKGHNLDMKKNMGQLFFHEESVYEMFKSLAFTVQKFQISPKSGKINQNLKILYFCQNLTESSQKLIRSSSHQTQPVYQI